MATRARIGIQQNKQIIASYQHWDGYPGGLGYKLEEYWTDPKKVTDAIKLGNASMWGMFIGEAIDFDDRNAETYYFQNVYYGRDRGEKDQGFNKYSNQEDYLDNGFNSGEEYIYLMKMTGKKDFLGKECGEWFYASYSNREWKPLMRDAVQEHIDILRRSCLKEEVA